MKKTRLIELYLESLQSYGAIITNVRSTNVNIPKQTKDLAVILREGVCWQSTETIFKRLLNSIDIKDSEIVENAIDKFWKELESISEEELE